MDQINTLNICMSHLPFPGAYTNYMDLMISPNMIVGPKRIAVVSDDYFGPHGGALSEYVQMLWLYDHFDAIAAGYDFVRLFHYRRLVARNPIGQPTDAPPLRWIRPEELGNHADEFSRWSETELFNEPISFEGGMIVQYAHVHMLEDLLNFGKFLIEQEILDRVQTAAFLGESLLIPACSTGIYKSSNLKRVLSVLRAASGFLKSPYFVPRVSFQRRLVGFLLERLHSFLLLRQVEASERDARARGIYTLISNDGVIRSSQ